MARARNPNRDRAYEIWASAVKQNQNVKLKDIAAQLGEAESTIRKWKCNDKWEEKEKGTLQKEKGNAPKKSRGAPKGNKNAIGNNGGAPTGNHNALKHGGYSKIYWDTLSEEEKELLNSMETDEEFLLLEQIKLCTIQEHRLMKAISKYNDLELENKTGLAVSGVMTQVTNKVFDDTEQGNYEKERYIELKTEKQNEGKISYFGKDQFTQTTTEATYNIISRLQSELTKVQRQKTQCIKELAEIRERQNSKNSNNALADDWIKAVMEAEKNE